MVKKPEIIDIRNQNSSQWQGTGNQHQFIVVHYLGVKNADNPNLYGGGYGGHFNITRDGTIYQAANYDTILWHVGTAGYYTKKYPNGFNPTNYNCIGIENSACYDSDWYFTKETEESLVKLVKWLMQELNIDADHVLRHYDVVNKNCPMPYVSNNRHNGNMTWDEFKAKLTKGETDVVADTLAKTKIVKRFNGETRYVAIKAGEYLNVHVAPDASSRLLSTWGHLSRGNGVQVFAKTEDNWCLVSIADTQVGWVNAKYLSVSPVN